APRSPAPGAIAPARARSRAPRAARGRPAAAPSSRRCRAASTRAARDARSDPAARSPPACLAQLRFLEPRGERAAAALLQLALVEVPHFAARVRQAAAAARFEPQPQQAPRLGDADQRLEAGPVVGVAALALAGAGE